MKVGIVIITYNLDCRVFILQIEAIRKFCQDPDYTIEVFDNSSNQELATAIKHHAGELGVKYNRTNPSTSDASLSHSFAANFSYKILKDTYDTFFYCDHDLIPIKLFSVEQILGNYIGAGVKHGINVKYFWPGCFMFKNGFVDKSLIDFSPNQELSIDTGGELRKLIENHGEDKFLFFDETGCQNETMITHKDYYFYIMIFGETFLHFLAASNWSKKERHEERINSLINIATNKIVESDIRKSE